MKKFDDEKMKQSITLFLEAIGEDLDSPHIKETPIRATKMWKVLLGQQIDPNHYVKLFPNGEGTHTPVMVTNINFYGFCAHHILPFYGQISIAYVPNKHLIGLSKLARISRHFAKRPQVQEDLTKQIAEFLQDSELKPNGVSVIVDANHMCASQRGVRAHGMRTRTFAKTGVYKEDIFLQSQFEKFANQAKEQLFRY